MSEVPLHEAPAPRSGFAGVLDRFVSGLAIMAGLLTAVMMAVTVIDVVGRNAFNRPLFGAFETTELLMVTIVFLALPFVTWRREHIAVTLIYAAFPARLQSFITGLGEIVAAIACGLLSWRAWLYAERLLGVGERTLELGVPRGLIPVGIALVLACAAILFALLALRSLLLGERAPT